LLSENQGLVCWRMWLAQSAQSFMAVGHGEIGHRATRTKTTLLHWS